MLNAVSVKRFVDAHQLGTEAELDVGGVVGLRLRITKAGVASWTLRYRAPAGQRRVTLGRWPEMALSTARAEARKALGRVADGADPSAEKRSAYAKRRGVTFGDVAKDWTSGKLAARFPDHVKVKRTASDDERLVRLYMKRIAGVPIELFTLDHAELVMNRLPDHLSPSTRRHVAQVIGRVLTLAVWPLRLREHSPIPKGWKPKPSAAKAKSYLYPAEDVALLACADVPLVRRVAFGLLGREGMRRGELLGLMWSDLDLERGVISLDTNKTDDPRAWALAPDVAEALRRWRKLTDNKERVIPLYELRSKDLRKDLELAGVKRPQLYERSAVRQPIRVHDLRATFVTLALAAGRSEAWVTDRTGHKSSAMVARYKRAARTAAELGLGWFVPLHEAIPELRGPAKVVRLDERRREA